MDILVKPLVMAIWAIYGQNGQKSELIVSSFLPAFLPYILGFLGVFWTVGSLYSRVLWCILDYWFPAQNSVQPDLLVLIRLCPFPLQLTHSQGLGWAQPYSGKSPNPYLIISISDIWFNQIMNIIKAAYVVIFPVNLNQTNRRWEVTRTIFGTNIRCCDGTS